MWFSPLLQGGAASSSGGVDQLIAPSSGLLTLSGFSPIVVQTANQAIISEAASLVTVGYLPVIQVSGIGKSGVARNLQVYYQQLFEDARKKKEAAWLKTLEERRQAKANFEQPVVKLAKASQKQVTAQKPGLKYPRPANQLPIKTIQQLIGEIILEYPIPVLDPPRPRKVRSKRVVEDEAIFALLYAD